MALSDSLAVVNLNFYTVLLILTAGVSKIMTAALPALSSQAAVS